MSNRLLKYVMERWTENLDEAARVAYQNRHRDMAKEVLERLSIVASMIEENYSIMREVNDDETNQKSQSLIEELWATCALLEKLLNWESEEILLKVLQYVVTTNYDFVELLYGVQEYVIGDDTAEKIFRDLQFLNQPEK